MARVIAIANQKGGVGKTTTAINLSASLAAADCRILLIDCDPQANTTSGLGVTPGEAPLSVYDLLAGTASASSVVIATTTAGLDLVPSCRDLAGANVELVETENREHRLKRHIPDLTDRYDFIVLDCPPALDLLTLNALTAADSVLIPIQCEYFALEGVSALMDTIDRIKHGLNPGLAIEGVLLTMFDERTTLARQVASDLREFFAGDVFETVIPRNVRLAEAPSHGKPALHYDVRSRGAESYLRLARELLARAAANAAAKAAD